MCHIIDLEPEKGHGYFEPANTEKNSDSLLSKLDVHFEMDTFIHSTIHSGVVRGCGGGEMPQAALALRAAFSVQESSDKGGIFSSPK